MAFQFKYLDGDRPLMYSLSIIFVSNHFFSISNFLFNWQLINCLVLLLLVRHMVCTLTTHILCFILQPPLKYTFYSNHPQHMLVGTSYSTHFILLVLLTLCALYSMCVILQELCAVGTSFFKYFVLQPLHTLSAFYSGHFLIGDLLIQLDLDYY